MNKYAAEPLLRKPLMSLSQAAWTFACLVALLLTSISATEAQNLKWLFHRGGDGQISVDVSTDSQANLYCTMRYRYPLSGDTWTETAIRVFDPFGQELNSYLYYHPQPTCPTTFITTVDDDGNTLVIVSDDNRQFRYIKYAPSDRWQTQLPMSLPSDVTPTKIVHRSGYQVVCGSYDDSTGSIEGWLCRMDSTGQMYWQNQFTFPNVTRTDISDFVFDPDSNIILTGITTGAERNRFITKYTWDGDLLFAHEIKGSKGIDEFSERVTTDTEGNIFIAGFTPDTSRTDYNTLWLAKYTQSGGEIWSNTYFTEEYLRCGGISTDESGHVIVGGAFHHPYSPLRSFFATLDSNGTFLSSNSIDFQGGIFRLIPGPAGDLYFGGIGSHSPEMGFYCGRISLVSTDIADDALPQLTTLSQNYPNPFNPTTTIQYTLQKPHHVSLIVTDLYGREIRRLIDSELEEAGSHHVQADAAGMPSGVYFYSLIAGEQRLTRKMVLLR